MPLPDLSDPSRSAPPPDEAGLRAAVVETCRSMARLGLNQGTSGNVSVRLGPDFLLTPSARPYDTMDPADVVRMRFDGTHEGRFRPSSEWRFHRDILQARPDVSAVVHAHPTYCTAFAMCRRDIPAAHYMIALAGGPTVRCSGYATFGTDELSRLALEALEGRTCCLLANHGMIATGPSLPKALSLAVELETLCRQYAIALGIGTPVILPDEEIARTAERFAAGYGLGPDEEPDMSTAPRPGFLP